VKKRNKAKFDEVKINLLPLGQGENKLIFKVCFSEVIVILFFIYVHFQFGIKQKSPPGFGKASNDFMLFTNQAIPSQYFQLLLKALLERLLLIWYIILALTTVQCME